MSSSRAWGILAGIVADRVLGDPRRGHPVAAFGTGAARLEAGIYRDTRGAGVLHTAAAVVPVTAVGWLLERRLRRHPWAHGAATAATTWAVLGAASLGREAHHMADHLEAGDLEAARARLRHL